jgi:DNA polymerase-1
LKEVVEIEKKVLWIVAQMECHGIGIDEKGIKDYYDGIMAKPERNYMDRIKGDRYFNQINQLGTITGRMTSTLDNVPGDSKIRLLFKAPAGYKLIIADYSNYELRIAFGLSDDQKGIQGLQTGSDPYIHIGKTILNLPEEDATKNREIIKNIILGLNNGRTAYGIHEDLVNQKLDIALEQMQNFVKKYFDYYQELNQWREQYLETGRREGIIRTRAGRIRNISEKDEKNSIYNFPIQGTGADGLKLSLISLDQALKGFDAQVVLTRHDEIIVEVREDQVDEVSKIVQDCMITTMEHLLPDVPFKVKLKIEDAWG